MTNYTVEDYNKTVFRGHVRADGRILHGIRSDGKLEWRKPEAFARHEQLRLVRNRNKRARRKHWINKYKLHNGCSVCGVKPSHPIMLQLDHINPEDKIDNVGNLAATNLKRLINEMRKCRVICFDCHVEHTANQNRKDKDND